MQVPVEMGAYMPESYPLLDLATTIQPDLHSQQEAAAPPSVDAEAGSGADMVPNIDITLNFENASYENIYAIIGQVEKMNKTTVLKSADISKGDTGLGGQLTFGFYSLPTLDEKQADLLKFNPVIPKGKPNPFN